MCVYTCIYMCMCECVRVCACVRMCVNRPISIGPQGNQTYHALISGSPVREGLACVVSVCVGRRIQNWTKAGFRIISG